MAYLTLDLPFGMHANGTVYQNRGRWFDGDRIRWHDNALRPIGGWRRFTTPLDEPIENLIPQTGDGVVRSLLIWEDNEGDFVGVAGSNLGLTAFRSSVATVEDITPAEFTPRPSVIGPNLGFGGYYFGLGTFGTPRPALPSSGKVFNWCFRLWGDTLLAAERARPSRLYQWDPNAAPTPVIATVVTGPPTDFDAMHVTAQRIVVVAGQPDDPRLVQWSDSEDFTDWTPTDQNQAGFQRLDGVGRFREIVTVRDQILLLSETDAWVARYIGPPYILGFDRLSDQTGVFNGNAVAVTEDFAVWPGPGDFFIFDGSSVKRMDCPVNDRLPFLSNTKSVGKVTAHINPDFSEVWWHYESANGSEADSYVVWDFRENHWATGTLDRTVGGGHPRQGGPFMVTPAGELYQHERAGVLPLEPGEPNSTIFAETGPIEISANGYQQQYVRYIQPDFIASGTCNVTLIGQDRPGGPETSFGPYAIGYPAQTRQPIPTRARGHTVRMRVEGANQNWTLGSLRLDLEGGGLR